MLVGAALRCVAWVLWRCSGACVGPVVRAQAAGSSSGGAAAAASSAYTRRLACQSAADVSFLCACVCFLCVRSLFVPWCLLCSRCAAMRFWLRRVTRPLWQRRRVRPSVASSTRMVWCSVQTRAQRREALSQTKIARKFTTSANTSIAAGQARPRTLKMSPVRQREQDETTEQS
jgi:hypothetical protein